MNGIILGLLIILLGFMVMFFPFRLRGTFHIDALSNIGFIVFKVLFIRLLSEKFKLSKTGKIEVVKEKNKKKKNKIISRKYFMCLAGKVEVRRVDLIFDAGAKENVFLVSILSGFVGVFVSIVSSIFLNRYKKVKIFNSFRPSFGKEQFEVTGDIIVSFCIMDMLSSIIRAFIYYLNLKKENKICLKKTKSMN